MAHDKEKDRYALRQRRLACENTRFEVFLDDVKDTNGEIVRDYLVVAPKIKTGDLISGVAILPIVDGKLGLLRIYRHAIQRHLWEIPRGFVDPGESDRSSALRELEEETGLSCADDDLESLGYLAPEPGILAARVHLFVATRCSTSKPFLAHELGHREFRLFDPTEIIVLMDSTEIEDPCTLVACLKHHGGLASRRETRLSGSAIPKPAAQGGGTAACSNERTHLLKDRHWNGEQREGVGHKEDMFFDDADVVDIVSFQQRQSRSEAAGSLLKVFRKVIRRKRFVLALAMTLLLVGFYALRHHGYLAPESIMSFFQSHPFLAPLVFLIIYAASVVCLIPTLPLNLGAGLIWGPYWGGILTVLGASTGAASAFLAARYLAADYLNARFDSAAWRWLREEIHRKGWKAVAFVRVNPVFPFGPSSYFFGLTPVGFRSYFTATMLSILPLSFTFAAIGHSIGSIVLEGDVHSLLRSLVLVSLAVTVLVLLRVAVKRISNEPHQ